MDAFRVACVKWLRGRELPDKVAIESCHDVVLPQGV